MTCRTVPLLMMLNDFKAHFSYSAEKHLWRQYAKNTTYITVFEEYLSYNINKIIHRSVIMTLNVCSRLVKGQDRKQESNF